MGDTGHRMLPAYIRVIQGDGVSYESLGDILGNMEKNKWAADNLAFGSGGALLQKMNRDTQKCAFKCSEITRNGESSFVFKDPITDKGKQSKKGRMTLELVDGVPTTVTEGKGSAENDLLVTVFKNGEVTKEWTFNEIRDKANMGIDIPPTI